MFTLTALWGLVSLGNTKAYAAALDSMVYVDKSFVMTRDITGDGKNDTIKVEVVHEDGYSLKSVQIYVNGRSAIKAEIKYALQVGVRYMSCSRKNSYLQIDAMGEDDEVILNKIYKYSGGKLRVAADLGAAGETPEVKKVTSKSIYVYFWLQPYETGGIKYTYIYQPKGNQLKLKNNTATVKSTIGRASWPNDGYAKYFKKNQFVTKIGHTYYTSANGKKKAFTTKKGDILTLKKIKIIGKKKYLCFAKGKKTGWIRATYNYTQKEWFYGVKNRLAG